MSEIHSTVSPSLLARAQENTWERKRRAARTLQGGVLVEEDGLLLTAVPDLPWVTGAMVTHVPRDPAATLARARSFFKEQALDWDLTAAGETAEMIAPIAAAAGFVRGETRPGMLLAPIAGEPPAVPGLAIREVRDAAALETFVITSAAGFGGGEELFRILCTEAALVEPGMTLYVGELDGVPVATAVLGASHGIAGIGGVSTVPAARRRGIGAAITVHAALDGLTAGCDASFLEATEMGYGVYARMGYRHVVNFQVWRPPDE